MVKSYGKIDDLTAMENIDRNNEEEKESYDSKYTDEERQLLESQKPRSSLRLRDNYKRVRKRSRNREW